MSRPTPPEPAKLVIGFFTPEKGLFPPVVAALERQYGPVDYISPWLIFNDTEYYAHEMGDVLFRRMLSFRQLIAQDRLPDIKLFTNELELQWTRDGNRRVNIDPGYLLPSRFVLATGKNFTHRVYLGRSIYADLTLVYVKGRFQTLPWTYPDYARPELQAILDQMRRKYLETRETCKTGEGERV